MLNPAVKTMKRPVGLSAAQRRVRRLLLAGLVALFTVGCGLPDPAVLTPPNDAPVLAAYVEDAEPAMAALPATPDELLVQPFPGADPLDLAALYAEVGATVVASDEAIELTTLQVPAGERDAVAERLLQSQLFETIQKNYLYEPQRIPNDPFYSRQPHLPQINAPAAWDLTLGGEDIIIAILDSGVEATHPDLSARIIGGQDVFHRRASFADATGHGTQVAGVAAAGTHNGVGVAGVAWDSSILAVRVGDDQGRSSSRHIASGILWAAGQGARVINVSFAPLWSNRVVQSAVQSAYHRGSLVVISSGNGGGMSSSPGYEEALFVGAVTGSNQIATFSDRGTFVDLVAPGTGIRTTQLRGGYGLVNGTSFAAPIVSGVAALAWSVNPELRPVSIVEALTSTAVDLGPPGPDSTFGFGLVDARAAVAYAAATAVSPDVTPPTVRFTRPSARSRLSGRIGIGVSATDVGGVADVVLSVDGLPFATDTRPPYHFVLDTRAFSPGERVLSVVATDHAGNASVPATLAVTFVNAGGGTGTSQITFRSPSAGASVTGNVSIQASVSDEAGFELMEWFVNGASVFVSPLSGRSSGVSYVWRTAGFARGPHTISLVVTNSLGQRTTGTLSLNVR